RRAANLIRGALLRLRGRRRATRLVLRLKLLALFLGLFHELFLQLALTLLGDLRVDSRPVERLAEAGERQVEDEFRAIDRLDRDRELLALLHRVDESLLHVQAAIGALGRAELISAAFRRSLVDGDPEARPQRDAHRGQDLDGL